MSGVQLVEVMYTQAHFPQVNFENKSFFLKTLNNAE
jgi:hypothetical protein